MQPTTTQPKGSPASDLFGDLCRHIAMMAPHQKDRAQGKLLIAARDEIKRLRDERQQLSECCNSPLVNEGGEVHCMNCCRAPNDQALPQAGRK